MFVIGMLTGGAIVGVIWYFIDSHGGVAAVEADIAAKAKAEAAALETKASNAVKTEVAKI